MPEIRFTKDDLKQLEGLGISEDHALAQIDKLTKPATFTHIERPCALEDGILAIPDNEAEALAAVHRAASEKGLFMKFVPASGAASRMFKMLLSFHNNETTFTRDDLLKNAESGDRDSRDLLDFLNDLEKFAFFDDLRSVMSGKGLDPGALAASGDYREILGFLLTSEGLDYAELPKGLLKFHRYKNGVRTPFEEHLVEAAEYVRDANGVCRLHFTVSPEHRSRFESLLENVGASYEKAYGVEYRVEFSIQKPSTDTIAVDENGLPFRLEDGSLLFRPGGHGALIENLNDLDADIVFVKNIDNVVPDRLKDPTYRWKTVLGGLLIRIREKIFAFMEALSEGNPDDRLIGEAVAFVRDTLSVAPPKSDLTPQKAVDFLISKLNRPIRICGVVKNVGEPGGGPFWVKEPDGTLSKQLVESAQLDPNSAQQKEIWNSATHFSPVDLVCGLRDYRGRPFDLTQYVDPDAAIIAEKSKDGRPLKALELPGLWNGAMARWNTIFVEVPIITFNPVKTVMDLLRKEHQPG